MENKESFRVSMASNDASASDDPRKSPGSDLRPITSSLRPSGDSRKSLGSDLRSIPSGDSRKSQTDSEPKDQDTLLGPREVTDEKKQQAANRNVERRLCRDRVWMNILMLAGAGTLGALLTHSTVDTISILVTAFIFVDSILSCRIWSPDSEDLRLDRSEFRLSLWRFAHALLFLMVCQLSTFLILLVTRNSGCNVICSENWLSVLACVYVSGSLFILFFSQKQLPPQSPISGQPFFFC